MSETARVDDLPVLDELGAALDRAMRGASAATPASRRAGRWRRFSPRAFAIALAIAVPAAGASAAGTLLVLRGDVIPAPRATPPEQTARPGTSRIAGVHAADPVAGRPAWTLRLATSQTGLLCSTAGQRVGGRFGIVGLDGRFRALAEGAVDSCSARRPNAASLLGARVFAADRSGDVRTVVSGVGGPTLRDVRVEARGHTQRVAVGAGGTFIAAFAGLPEDLALRVALRFADGHVERHAFGVGPMVFPDPGAGHAWRLESGTMSGSPLTCITVRNARERASGAVQSPGACGRLAIGRRAPKGLFFAVRRLTPGSGGRDFTPFGDGHWGRTPARLLVWGAAGSDVAAVDVRGPAHTGTWFRPNGAFAFMFGPGVRPGDVRVIVRLRDGRRLERSASYHLLPPPTFGRKP